jgi:dihydroorotate dehydrogenase
VAEKAAKTRTTKEVMVAKAAEEGMAVKVAVDKAVVAKVAADKSTVTKVAEEAMVKVAAHAAAMNTTD